MSPAYSRLPVRIAILATTLAALAILVVVADRRSNSRLDPSARDHEAVAKEPTSPNSGTAEVAATHPEIEPPATANLPQSSEPNARLAAMLSFLPEAVPPSASVQSDRIPHAETEARVEAMLQYPHLGDRVMLEFASNATAHAAENLLASLGASLERHYGKLANGRMVTLRLDGSKSVRDALLDLMRSDIVAYAEPDYLLSTCELPMEPVDEFFDPALAKEDSTASDDEAWMPTGAGGEFLIEALPNDYSSSTLYGMARIGAPAVWDSLPDPEVTDPVVVVAVIDTGVRYTHEDLSANMWTNPGETAGNGIDDDGNGYIDDVFGINAITGSGNPADDNGHGTHVAGTIGAVGNNGKGVLGVAWKVRVRMMALKFLPASGSGATSDAVECILYAVDHGAHVLNNSWGGGGPSTSLSNAISYAAANNVLFVAAAGNTSSNNDASPRYPSSYTHENIIAVASSDTSDARSSFSCYGATSVDIFAPGSSIVSTYHSNDSSYATLSGTSMATPMVSGVAAVLRVAHPGEDYRQLRERIFSTGDRVSQLASFVYTGSRINLNRSVGANLSIDEDDLLWHNRSSGKLSVWKMNGTTRTGAYTLSRKVTGWQLKGRGDLDGDGDQDMVWLNPSTGVVSLWTMAGSTRVSAASVSKTAPGWNLAAIGDLDLDSDLDLIWQHPTTRKVVVWYLDGTTATSVTIAGAEVSGWNIFAVHDQGQGDDFALYWHNPSTGKVTKWLMDGLQRSNAESFTATAIGWQVNHVADLNQDGHADIAWFNPTTGKVVYWYMNGRDRQSTASVDTTAVGWSLAPRVR